MNSNPIDTANGVVQLLAISGLRPKAIGDRIPATASKPAPSLAAALPRHDRPGTSLSKPADKWSTRPNKRVQVKTPIASGGMIVAGGRRARSPNGGVYRTCRRSTTTKGNGPMTGYKRLD